MNVENQTKSNIKYLLIEAYIQIAILKGDVDEHRYYNDSQYQDNTIELTKNHINNLLKQFNHETNSD